MTFTITWGLVGKGVICAFALVGLAVAVYAVLVLITFARMGR